MGHTRTHKHTHAHTLTRTLMPTRSAPMGDQQWETVVLNKRTPRGNQAQSGKNVNAARQAGGGVVTQGKYGAGTNSRGAGGNAGRLDDETSASTIDRVPLEVRKAISQARQLKKMSQKDLATRLNEKVQVINEYESGKAIPSNGMLARMERVLECKLPRPPKKKKKKDDQ